MSMQNPNLALAVEQLSQGRVVSVMNELRRLY